MDTLLSILEYLQPKLILEFGSGKSTKVLSMYPSTVMVVSMEHDKVWYDKLKGELQENVILKLEPDLDTYATGFIRMPYDLSFIDGRNRMRCLKESLKVVKDSGVILIHDADRERYRDEIKKYPFKIFTDDGCTVSIFQNKETMESFRAILLNLDNFIGVKSS